jgi:hypothetical protein
VLPLSAVGILRLQAREDVNGVVMDGGGSRSIRESIGHISDLPRRRSRGTPSAENIRNQPVASRLVRGLPMDLRPRWPREAILHRGLWVAWA